MSSDFTNLKDSGRACVGCGRGPAEGVMLKRINTYARGLSCPQCYAKYISCANKSPEGRKCGHNPNEHTRHGDRLCCMPGCACPGYRHGLEDELDRQFADCVGKQARVGECTGYGAKLGKCGRIILQKPDGSVPRLCDHCETEWIKQTIEGAKEVHALMDIDPEKVELPY